MNGDAERQAVKSYLDRLPEGVCYDVDITRHAAIRSNPQNNLYWKWVGIVARETGNDSDMVHKVFAGKFLGRDIVEVFGQKVSKVRTTTKLSTEEFSTYLDQIDAFCATELKIILPHPDDAIYDQISEQ